MKKALLYIIVILLSVMSVIVPAYKSSVFSDNDFMLYVLGDSIAAGVGLSGYSQYISGNVEICEDSFGDQISESLATKYPDINVKCDAISGYNMQDFIIQLDSENVQNNLSNADATVISIGANNILVPTVNYLGSHNILTCDVDELDPILEKGIDAFRLQIKTVINKLSQYDCEKYFMTIYNPYRDLDVAVTEFIDDNFLISLVINEQEVDAQIQKIMVKCADAIDELNEIIATYNGKNMFVVDVFSAFDAIGNDYNDYINIDTTRIVINYSTGQLQNVNAAFDPHPTIIGAQKIADTFTNSFFVTGDDYTNIEGYYTSGESIDLKVHTLYSQTITGYQWDIVRDGGTQLVTNATTSNGYYEYLLGGSVNVGSQTLVVQIKNGVDSVKTVTANIQVYPMYYKDFNISISKGSTIYEPYGNMYFSTVNDSVTTTINYSTKGAEDVVTLYVDGIQTSIGALNNYAMFLGEVKTYEIKVTVTNTLRPNMLLEKVVYLNVSNSYDSPIIVSVDPDNLTQEYGHAASGFSFTTSTSPINQSDYIWYLNGEIINIGSYINILSKNIVNLPLGDNEVYMMQGTTKSTSYEVLVEAEYQITKISGDESQTLTDIDDASEIELELSCDASETVEWLISKNGGLFEVISGQTGNTMTYKPQSADPFGLYTIKAVVGDYISENYEIRYYQKISNLVITQTDYLNTITFSLSLNDYNNPNGVEWYIEQDGVSTFQTVGATFNYQKGAYPERTVYAVADDQMTNVITLTSTIPTISYNSSLNNQVMSESILSITITVANATESDDIIWYYSTDGETWRLRTGAIYPTYIFAPSRYGNYYFKSVVNDVQTNSVEINVLSAPITSRTIECVSTDNNGNYVFGLTDLSPYSDGQNIYWYKEGAAPELIGRGAQINFAPSYYGVFGIYAVILGEQTNHLTIDNQLYINVVIWYILGGALLLILIIYTISKIHLSIMRKRVRKTFYNV